MSVRSRYVTVRRPCFHSIAFKKVTQVLSLIANYTVAMHFASVSQSSSSLITWLLPRPKFAPDAFGFAFHRPIIAWRHWRTHAAVGNCLSSIAIIQTCARSMITECGRRIQNLYWCKKTNFTVNKLYRPTAVLFVLCDIKEVCIFDLIGFLENAYIFKMTFLASSS